MTGRPQADPAALADVLADPLGSRGLDLEGVEVSSAGRRRLVRVLVDRDGGITLDDIADITSLVSAELDDHDVLGDRPYTLEVTSPGVDRPLTLPRHWSRNVDRLVKVTPHDGPPYTGRVLSAADGSALLDVDGSEREVRYGDVATARVEIEFNRRRTGPDLAQAAADVGPSASVSDVGPSASVSDVGPSASVSDVGPSASVSDVGPSASVSDVGPSASVPADSDKED